MVSSVFNLLLTIFFSPLILEAYNMFSIRSWLSFKGCLMSCKLSQRRFSLMEDLSKLKFPSNAVCGYLGNNFASFEVDNRNSLSINNITQIINTENDLRTYDVIVVDHHLSNIPSQSQRLEFIDKLEKLVDDRSNDNLVLIIEPIDSSNPAAISCWKSEFLRAGLHFLRSKRTHSHFLLKFKKLSCSKYSQNAITGGSSNSILSNSLLSAPVSIIGGGLGGVALALLLEKNKIPVKIFEKDLDFDLRKQGYALTMQQAAIPLRTLQLSEDVVELGTTSFSHQSFSKDGKLLGAYGPIVRNGNFITEETARESIGENFLSSRQYVEYLLSRRLSRHNIHIPRQVLRRLLLDRVSSSTLEWNKKLVNFEKADNAYILQFDDGTEVKSNIVIGADGIHGNIRQFLFPSRKNDLNYLGLMVILGISPVHENDSYRLCGHPFRKQIQWLDGSTRVFTMPFDDKHTMWQLSFPLDEMKAREYGSSSCDILQNLALHMCNGWDPHLVALLESTLPGLIYGHPTYDRNPLSPVEISDTGYPGVTILGDAAHPMSPFKGQGANQALLDAMSICQNLLSSELMSPNGLSLNSALRNYEIEMIQRSSEKVLMSREAAFSLHSDDALNEAHITRASAAARASKKSS